MNFYSESYKKIKLLRKTEDSIFTTEDLIYMHVSEGVWGDHISIKWCLYISYK